MIDTIAGDVECLKENGAAVSNPLVDLHPGSVLKVDYAKLQFLGGGKLSGRSM